MADDHAQALARVDLSGQLDDPVERAVERAHAFERSHQALADAEHGLDLEHRPEQRARAADPSAAAQELERRDREESLHSVSHRARALDDCVGALTLRGHLRSREREQTERHGDELRVNHSDAFRIRHLGRLHRGRVRPAQLFGDVYRDDLAVVGEQLVVNLCELTRRRLRRRWMRGRVGELAIELRRADVDAVE